MLFRDIEECVQPVEGGLEVEVVPEAVTEDECVGTLGFLGGDEGAEAVKLVGWDGEADHHFDLNVMLVIHLYSQNAIVKLTNNIDGICWTSQTLRVILNDIGGLKDSLNRTGFDIELVVAEAILSTWISARNAQNVKSVIANQHTFLPVRSSSPSPPHSPSLS